MIIWQRFFGLKVFAYSFLCLLAFLSLGHSNPALAERFITVASTTSTANSGLFDRLLPIFQEQTGIEVRVVAVGTGQALRLARSGDADVLFVHHRPSEEVFVQEGYGIKRFDVMYNDFVIVGPKSDPAAIRGEEDVTAALKKIAAKGAIFASRGDDSGTHKKERGFWQAADIDVSSENNPWYRELGAGMGATLNTAVAMNAYTLTDRGTWLSFENREGLEILVAGDKRLFNPYGIVLSNNERFPHVKSADGQIFIDWLLSDEGQSAIANYKIKGEQLFFPNAPNDAQKNAQKSAQKNAL